MCLCVHSTHTYLLWKEKSDNVSWEDLGLSPTWRVDKTVAFEVSWRSMSERERRPSTREIFHSKSYQHLPQGWGIRRDCYYYTRRNYLKQLVQLPFLSSKAKAFWPCFISWNCSSIVVMTFCYLQRGFKSSLVRSLLLCSPILWYWPAFYFPLLWVFRSLFVWLFFF